jgi:RNA polymerase sigma factor (TIGR02999 family)
MSDASITKLLSEAAQGQTGAEDRLVTAVVHRLEAMAGRELAASNRGGLDGLTMEPRMLAHDVLMRIFDQDMAFENRRHFFSYASKVMSRCLIDYQRKRAAQKRGGGQFRVTLSDLATDTPFDLLDVPEVLEELKALDERKAELVGLRVFWGADMSEIADILGISVATADRDWRFTRQWLAARLDRGDD